MRIVTVAVVVLLSAASASAGDYTLFVADAPDAGCVPPVARSGEKYNPVHTAAEVAADVIRHFKGEQSKIALFEVAFQNGHVVFCGSTERERVYEALVAAAELPEVAHERDFEDYARMLGNAKLEELARRALDNHPEESGPARRLRSIVEALASQHRGQSSNPSLQRTAALRASAAELMIR